MKIGIDPGLNGAIAFVSDKKIKLFDMPVMEIPWAVASKYHRMVDSVKLYNLIKNCPHEIESVTMEIVGVMPTDGKSVAWVFAGAFYTAFNVIRLSGYEPRMVRPTQWKKKFGLINMPKDMSRLAVLKMYPDLLPQLKRKKDVDRAEALMIAVS